jgi:hypothetical protein
LVASAGRAASRAGCSSVPALEIVLVLPALSRFGGKTTH